MVQYNNEPVIQSILLSSTTTQDTNQTTAPSHRALSPEPVLVTRLPSSSELDSLGRQRAKQAQRQHILHDALTVALDTPLDAHPVPAPLPSNTTTITAAQQLINKQTGHSGRPGAGGKYESHDVWRAIEQKDLMTLYDIRSSNFNLLLTPVGGITPLVYSMRLGKTHSEVAICLVGALSKRVNDITDEELEQAAPETKSQLRSIRVNLKLAISHGLATSDTSLLASFIQVSIMSEGDKWLLTSSHSIALALRAGPKGRPVHAAATAIDKYVSRELKSSQVASVDEYIANATGDLVLLGLWSVVTDKLMHAAPVPLYFFARDDRTVKALEERLDELKRNGDYSRLTKVLRQQLENAVQILRKRNVGGRDRIHELRRALDEEGP